jgi:amino acid transporter
MGAKIAAAFLTLIANIFAGIVGFVALIVALDGQSESDAGYGMAAYGILVFLIAFAMAVLAFVLVHFLLKREFTGWKAAFLAIVTFSIVGVVLIFVCIVIGVGIAEYLRLNY